MIAVDSSVAIAGFASWHEQHASARKVLARSPRLVAHAALETYSVLTRLPPPHRAQADLVRAFLTSRFPGHLLSLPDNQYRELLDLLAERQILGGRVYDALIGMTAAAHEATLVSFDRRAALMYEAVGVNVELPD
ncbi:type II toxin-antitoxin system VapC family toxin [Natronosporangium hydrolyticum]|uniref:Ribonuclease VapC n=1 Tax=Natronosporangium hydrolyticum TaxID=2811111 RepID=A0A895YCD0_9ACTN|nr:type II toxin-antitoxin system VapC family toxin [Natronosporangium hydrolyticum]QSB12979.1 type II toxin-antitoxin system VapC family toxin [Natronosporangium hydrolyticum]